MPFGESRRHADAGPAADARIHADVLLAVVHVREHVADDPGRGLELPKFLAVLGAHCFEVALERPVEGDITRCRQRTGPHRETLWLGPYDFARCRIPRNEVAHAAVAIRRR